MAQVLGVRSNMGSEKVQFGAFVLDVDRYELSRAGKPVRLERIPMDLLILLVREKGRLISREKIIDRLWGKNLYFVFQWSYDQKLWMTTRE